MVRLEKKNSSRSSCVAVVVIALAYGVQFATPPAPTTPTATPVPPTPHMGAPPPKLDMSADFASTQGFNLTVESIGMEQAVKLSWRSERKHAAP